jgi:peptidyl-prolyl cis-trans isomerase B (cyclophilin B)
MLTRTARIPLALAALLLLVLTACSSEDSGDDTTAGDPGTSEASAESSPTESSNGAAAAGTCTYNPDGMDPAKKVDPPPAEPTEAGKVDVTLDTNVGAINATLDAGTTPCTVNSFLSLAEQGYFDETTCHRLTTEGIFVLQCGDPTATGTGGPGYQFDDELTGEETYPAGSLAMANAGPGTNGSQFFIVFADTSLAPNYTVFGAVDAAGLKVVTDIAAGGQDGAWGDGTGKPKLPAVITSATVG